MGLDAIDLGRLDGPWSLRGFDGGFSPLRGRSPCLVWSLTVFGDSFIVLDLPQERRKAILALGPLA
jgi:hypothetical protein